MNDVLNLQDQGSDCQVYLSVLRGQIVAVSPRDPEVFAVPFECRIGPDLSHDRALRRGGLLGPGVLGGSDACRISEPTWEL